MKLAELRPGDRIHLRRRIELHRARAERNHAVHQREVARLERPHVAEHLRLGVVSIENRVQQIRRRPRRRRPVRRCINLTERHLSLLTGQHAGQESHVGFGRYLIEGNCHRSRIEAPQVDPLLLRSNESLTRRRFAKFEPKRIEIGGVADRDSRTLQRPCQPASERTHS